MGKARVGVRLKEAVVGTTQSKNRSADLEQLTNKYNEFCKKLKGLIISLKGHYASMHQLQKTRLEVAYRVASLTPVDSPMFVHTGQMPTKDKPAEMVCSYLSVHEGLAKKSQMYCSKYAQFVVDYAVEWEKVVTARVTAGLKKAEQLRVEADHYQKKVEALRLSANQSMAKGKMVDPKFAERLTRNEDKLQTSRQSHLKFTSDLCTLIEEVTDRSWRDMHPLLVKIVQFDITLSDDESKTLTIMNGVVNELKRLATTHGIKPQARLKEIDTLDPTLLSTKVGGDAASASAPLAIEGGFSGLSLGGDTASIASGMSKSAAPPSTYPSLANDWASNVSGGGGGSHAPQSFPVQVSSGGGGGGGGGMSTLDMLNISASAAPPPTMDQVNESFGGGGGGGGTTSHYAGSFPPPLSQSNMVRNYSFDSFDSGISGFSGASAPPPSSAPPPPPPPAPGSFGGPGGFSSNASYGSAQPPPPQPNPFGNGPTPPNSYGAPPPRADRSNSANSANSIMSLYGSNNMHQQQQQQPPQYSYNSYTAPLAGGPPPPMGSAPNAPWSGGGGGYTQPHSMYPPPAGAPGGGPPRSGTNPFDN